jgi:ATP-dependent DNA helicase PIF1
MFRSLSRPLQSAPPPESGPPPSQLTAEPEPTELFPLRQEVSRANAARLGGLATPVHYFAARDSGKAEGDRKEKLLENLPVGATVVLKAGAQVMLVKNLDREEGGRMVNGCVGRVLGFWKIGEVIGDQVPDKGVAAVRNVRMEENGEVPIARAVKDDTAENKENREDGKSPGPAKLSKPRSKAPAREKDTERYPLVFFSTPQGNEVVLLVREEFRVEDSEGNVLVRRMQVRSGLANRSDPADVIDASSPRL